ncbi:MAG: DUF1080 domain-containing protein [Tepidisphaeraceae bacterium]|jgi:hypothetical protein
MFRMTSILIACVALASFAFAEPPKQEEVQGLYEGTFKDARGEHKLEVRVVAAAAGAYKVLIRQSLPENKVAKTTLAAKPDGDVVRVAGKASDVEWAGLYADGAFKGTCGPGGTFEFKRITRTPATLGAQPPAGAIVLLDGKNFDEVVKKPLKDGTEQQWKLIDGGIEVPKGGMFSKRPITGSFKLHVEFKIPLMPTAVDQARGNSGVFMPNGQEIQVLDSFGAPSYTGGGCGGLYRYKDPDAFDEFSLASLPPLQWQTYDIEYRVEQKDGKPTGKPTLTVLHNGIKIHDDVTLKQDARAGTFQFQDHNNPVQFRNIWMVPIEGK